MPTPPAAPDAGHFAFLRRHADERDTIGLRAIAHCPAKAP
jgi:hypothetical protein